MFPYMLDSRHSSGSGVAPFSWNVFEASKPFHIPSCGNIEVIPLPVEHGRDHAPVRRPYICMGFRMKDFSYIGDLSCIPEDTKEEIGRDKDSSVECAQRETTFGPFQF